MIVDSFRQEATDSAGALEGSGEVHAPGAGAKKRRAGSWEYRVGILGDAVPTIVNVEGGAAAGGGGEFAALGVVKVGGGDAVDAGADQAIFRVPTEGAVGGGVDRNGIGGGVPVIIISGLDGSRAFLDADVLVDGVGSCYGGWGEFVKVFGEGAAAVGGGAGAGFQTVADAVVSEVAVGIGAGSGGGFELAEAVVAPDGVAGVGRHADSEIEGGGEIGALTKRIHGVSVAGTRDGASLVLDGGEGVAPGFVSAECLQGGTAALGEGVGHVVLLVSSGGADAGIGGGGLIVL